MAAKIIQEILPDLARTSKILLDNLTWIRILKHPSEVLLSEKELVFKVWKESWTVDDAAETWY